MCGDFGLYDASVAARAPLACLDVLEFNRLGNAGPPFLVTLSSMLSVMSVGTLKISGQVFWTDIDDRVQPIVHLRQLILLKADFLGQHVGYLESILAPNTFRAVALQCNRVGSLYPQIPALIRFLSCDVARSLVSVDLDFGEGAIPDDIPETTRTALGAALAGCTQLTHLRLGVLGWCNSSYCRRDSEYYIPIPQPPMLVPLFHRSRLPSACSLFACECAAWRTAIGGWTVSHSGT
ncbi:hypothetical protein C8T65DRAFT_261915 [Cerioporus squamosus]|nr:hypothetical protein C8T65DRAFT_261915 [Cerioporus squamosus]